jgi:hypothetical protein
VIEIFNNFKRSSENKIHYNDFISSLKIKTPSSNYVQSDPSYLQQLENKIITYENRIKELQHKVDLQEKNEEKFILVYEAIEKDKKELQEKVVNMEKEAQSNKKVLSEVLTNNFINSKDNKGNTNSKEDPVQKLKIKIKLLEEQNLKNLNEFDKRIKEYDAKIINLTQLLEKKESKEKQDLDKKYETSIKENIELRKEITETKLKKDSELIKLQAKVKKYQIKYRTLKEKIEENGKMFGKNITYNEKSDFNEIEKKIIDLEKKNLEREEHYKVLCMNANSYQVNKEVESITKKFEIERKEYLKTINMKNQELLLMKREFEEILRELEDLKYSKKLK